MYTTLQAGKMIARAKATHHMQRVIAAQLEVLDFDAAKAKFPKILSKKACEAALMAAPIPWKTIKKDNKRKSKWGSTEQRLAFEFNYIPAAVQGLISDCRLNNAAASDSSKDKYDWETFTLPGTLSDCLCMCAEMGDGS